MREFVRWIFAALLVAAGLAQEAPSVLFAAAWEAFAFALLGVVYVSAV